VRRVDDDATGVVLFAGILLRELVRIAGDVIAAVADTLAIAIAYRPG